MSKQHSARESKILHSHAVTIHPEGVETSRTSLLLQQIVSEARTETIFQASASNDLTVLKNLKDKLQCVDVDHKTPLHIAASKGNKEAVEFLIENGANVNARDKFGFSPREDAGIFH